MSQKKRKILEHSFAWIRCHPYASNLDVPDELIIEWMFKDDGDDPSPPGFHMSVFGFGYLQREVLTSASTLPRQIRLQELCEYFGRWQMKLGLAQVNRLTNLQIEPLPLFDFADGEEIEYRFRGQEDSR